MLNLHPSLDIHQVDLRTSRVMAIFGQCINVLNYNIDYAQVFLLLLKLISLRELMDYF